MGGDSQKPQNFPPQAHNPSLLVLDREKFVYFWRHDEVPYGVLCNWSPHPVGEAATAEHALMLGKARLFGDEAVATKLLRSTDPKEAKALGRAVKGFEQSKWDECKLDVMTDVLRRKAAQHAEVRALLMGTEDATLVEASPLDKIWGIGMSAAKAALCSSPAEWKGQNLLGGCWMRVREELRRQEEEEVEGG